MQIKRRVNNLERTKPAGKGSLYPKWQAIGLLFHYMQGPHAARLSREGKTEELKALFFELIADLDGTHPPYWDLSNLDKTQLDWAVQTVADNLDYLSNCRDGENEPKTTP